MNNISRDIFKALHEGRWLHIKYKNQSGSVTNYWIGIKGLDIRSKKLHVDGLHLSLFTVMELDVFIDGIISSSVIDGTYQPLNHELIKDIKDNPEKYSDIFKNTANMKILNYLADCNRMDSTPYESNYALIGSIDNEKLTPAGYELSDEQFRHIINHFKYKTKSETHKNNIHQMCLNMLSVNTEKGLYVLAYRQLLFDVVSKALRPDDAVTICREFSIDGKTQSIHRFLDADDYYLVNDFEKNAELIKDRIMHSGRKGISVDDVPYLICIERSIAVDLTDEYAAIADMYGSAQATAPIKAFFGELTTPSRRRKDYPIVLVNKRINLDQLRAIHKAIKYPLTYVQGPPGTGKTNTIINTIITAFFNERTVLFSSYNNHPIDSVFDELRSMKYKGKLIPFPVIRLGKIKEVTPKTIEYIKEIYARTKNITVFGTTLGKKREGKAERTKQLTELLKKHEEIVHLKERRDAIESISERSDNLAFNADLKTRQLSDIDKRLTEVGEVTFGDALKLLTDDEEDFKEYLYYTCAGYIKRLDEPKYSGFMDIINAEINDDSVRQFIEYIRNEENLLKLLRVFPVAAATCISAHKLGEPKPYFDMTIIDEASQCNTAVSLIPIIRGNNLMLVGDPHQLSPVIVLDPNINDALRKKYSVAKEYDYISNSIYKTYLACDAVSDEILLSHHYRCNKSIIDFNNKKYYGGKLKIETRSTSEKPLVFCDIKENKSEHKNIAPAEIAQVVQYAQLNKDKSIAVITPFVNQRDGIMQVLEQEGINNVSCGTVHAFQGDQKDIVLFSLALTDQTTPRTYEWLKNNKELINVATSRAREQLIVLSSQKELNRLHKHGERDDIYDLINYVKNNGQSEIASLPVTSRALGIKPYSTQTEETFLTTLNHVLGNILYSEKKCSVKREVAIAHVFKENIPYSSYFYSGRFDFVIYEKDFNKQELPVLAIELDGKEHFDDEIVKERDRKKKEICEKHGFTLIRVENSYARRYCYIKDILVDFFKR